MSSAQVNAVSLYLVVGGIVLFIAVMCVVFMVKSYRAGVAMGMEKTLLRRSITSSLTFTILPSVSILLGVIALSGSLGVPVSWLRLSVVGALQYELNVAEIAAKATGMPGLRMAELTPSSFATIVLVMTAGILGGCICCIFFLKKYLKKVNGKPKAAQSEGGEVAAPKKSFSTIAIVAMFVGLCSAYIASYIGQVFDTGTYLPLFTAGVAAAAMAVFEFFTVKKKMGWLDNFSLAVSMLIAMTAAVLISL